MEGYRDSTFSSIFSAEVDSVWECLLDISVPIFLQQCLQLMPFPPSPRSPFSDHSYTHTHSHLISSTLPKCGNFRHPSRLMWERLLSKLSQHATNTPAPLTYLEVALTFIRGISHKLYPSKAQIGQVPVSSKGNQSLHLGNVIPAAVRMPLSVCRIKIFTKHSQILPKSTSKPKCCHF